MTQLFINSFLNKDYDILFQKLQFVLILWVIVLAAIIIDLVSGLYKAKQLGEIHTSFGFRRTVSKAIQYYGLMGFALMFDILASLFLSLPYFSFACCVFLAFIEAKSVFEKAGEKDRRRMYESFKDLLSLIENKDNILKGIEKIVDNKHPSKDTNNENN